MKNRADTRQAQVTNLALRECGHLTKDEFPPTRLKPYLPEGIEKLLEKLWGSYKEYPASAICWRCEQSLFLQSLKFEWPIGPIDIYFGRVPGYECSSCNQQYLPDPVLDSLSDCVDKELERLPLPPPFRNPDRILPVA